MVRKIKFIYACPAWLGTCTTRQLCTMHDSFAQPLRAWSPTIPPGIIESDEAQSNNNANIACTNKFPQKYNNYPICLKASCLKPFTLHLYLAWQKNPPRREACELFDFGGETPILEHWQLRSCVHVPGLSLTFAGQTYNIIQRCLQCENMTNQHTARSSTTLDSAKTLQYTINRCCWKRQLRG